MYIILLLSVDKKILIIAETVFPNIPQFIGNIKHLNLPYEVGDFI